MRFSNPFATILFIPWLMCMTCVIGVFASLCNISATTIVSGSYVPEEFIQSPDKIRVESVFADQIPAIRTGEILVNRHLYLAAVNIAAKQPSWVAYTVKRADWDTDRVLERNFNTPPSLRDSCLEQSDYAGGPYDLGHLYAIQFVAANEYAAEVNQLCAIAAQTPDLNRGPWLRIETRIKQLSATAEVKVLAGQFWRDSMLPLPKADEPHKIASHCWIWFHSGVIEEAYVVPQTCDKDAESASFLVDVRSLKRQISERWYGEAVE